MGVVREHVGEADEGGLALGVLGVMALDRRGHGTGQAPAAGEDAANEGVIDAELAALAMHALLGRLGVAVNLLGVAGVGVRENELADVVQQRGDHEAVAVLVAGLLREAVGGALGGDAVQAEALGRGVPDGRALEEVEGAGTAGERLDRFGREDLHGLDDRLDPAAARAVELVGEAHDADDKRDVGFDGRDDVRRRHALGADQPQQAVAGFRERRERLECFERGGQPASVALVVVPLDGCAAGAGAYGCCGRDHVWRSLPSRRDRWGTTGIGTYGRLVECPREIRYGVARAGVPVRLPRIHTTTVATC